MAGGQSGAGVVGEAVYTLVGAFVAGILVGVFFLGGCGSAGGDATADNNAKCEAAWYDANDNDPESVPDPVVDAPWCVSHASAMRVEARQDDMETIGVEATP
jgi:hypothetical protein